MLLVCMREHSSLQTHCVFYLVGCLLSKGAHYIESLFYCVQQINKWEARRGKKNRYENVYFALLKSLSTKGYQQLL